MQSANQSKLAISVAYQDPRMVQGGAEVVPELTGNVNHI